MSNIVSKGDRAGLGARMQSGSVPGVRPAASVSSNSSKDAAPGVKPAASVPNNTANAVTVTPAPGVKPAASVPDNTRYTSSYHKAYGKRFPPGQVGAPGGRAVKIGYVDVAQPKSGNEPHTGSTHRTAMPNETHLQRHQRHARVLYPSTHK